MASLPAVFEKLCLVYRRPEEVADLPQVRRRTLVTQADVVGSTALEFGALAKVIRDPILNLRDALRPRMTWKAAALWSWCG